MAELTREKPDFEAIVNGLYTERNLVAQAFACLAQRHGWHMGVLLDPAYPEWPVLVIDTPEGQVSFHIAKHDLLGKWPNYQGKWDGHTTEEKYRRVKRFIGKQLALETKGHEAVTSTPVQAGPAYAADTQQ